MISSFDLFSPSAPSSPLYQSFPSLLSPHIPPFGRTSTSDNVLFPNASLSPNYNGYLATIWPPSLGKIWELHEWLDLLALEASITILKDTKIYMIHKYIFSSSKW
jgi:hypothetical protein